MTRHAFRLPLFFVTMTVLAFGVMLGARQAPPLGYADAVLGRWDLTVQSPDGPYPSWVHVQLRKETELQGRFVGRFGSVRNITKVDYRDGTLTFDVPIQYEQNKSDLHFESKLVGDKLEGTTVAADGTTLKWTGVRAPAFGPDRIRIHFSECIEMLLLTLFLPESLSNGCDRSFNSIFASLKWQPWASSNVLICAFENKTSQFSKTFFVFSKAPLSVAR